MDTKTKVLYTTMKRRTPQYKKSFLLRCGLVVALLLTFYVLLTIYNQLRQASDLLMEIKLRHIALNTNNTIVSKSGGSIKPDMATGDTEFDNDIFDQVDEFAKSPNDSDFAENTENYIGQAIRRRFQENIYMIRKRSYESKRLQTKAVADRRGTQDAAQIDSKILHTADEVDSAITRETREANPQFPRGTYAKNIQDMRGTQAENSPRVSGGARVEIDPHKTRTNAIIVAYHRSGSSFLGEMFNRDPNIFYLFEPIHTIDAFLDARRRFPMLYDTLIRNLFDTIFKCDFSKHPLFVSTLTSSGFRLKSQALTSEGLCDPRVTSAKMHLCRRINATLLTKLCRSRPHTVVKTIRMADWKNLDFLLEQDSFRASTSFKVIHLVRDPRGIIASRASWILDRQNATSHGHNAARTAIAKYVRIISAQLCKQMKSDINDWTKRSKLGKPYAMVRYEDAAMKPLTAYKEISKFAGVAQSKIVIGWLEKNTKCVSDPDYYSTTRNSSAVPHLWRRRLTIPLVEEIQKSCAEVMGIMGYKLVHNEKQLKNMKESLVIDWGNRGFLRTKPYIANNR